MSGAMVVLIAPDIRRGLDGRAAMNTVPQDVKHQQRVLSAWHALTVPAQLNQANAKALVMEVECLRSHP